MNHRDLSATQMVDHMQALEAQRDRWQELATTDRLTGMANRFGLELRANARDGWFVVCDLNGFKRAQDEHPEGHNYGDRVLREFADFLEGSCRTNRGRAADRVAARVGGDEFVVWCPTRHGARRIKLRVRAWRSQDHRVSASAGLGKDMATADATMYQYKKDLR